VRLIGAGTRDDIAYVERDTFWTAPNLITLVRFLLVPVFVILVSHDHVVWAFWSLGILFSTDWVDGYVARRFNQVSSVGKWLDPLVDRVSLVVVSATFVVCHIAPAWFVWAIVVPDLVLFLNTLFVFGRNPELPVSVLGKLRTAVLMTAAPLLLLAQAHFSSAPILAAVCTALLALGSLMHIAAAVGYLVAARRKVRGERASAAVPHAGAADPAAPDTPPDHPSSGTGTGPDDGGRL